MMLSSLIRTTEERYNKIYYTATRLQRTMSLLEHSYGNVVLTVRDEAIQLFYDDGTLITSEKVERKKTIDLSDFMQTGTDGLIKIPPRYLRSTAIYIGKALVGPGNQLFDEQIVLVRARVSAHAQVTEDKVRAETEYYIVNEHTVKAIESKAAILEKIDKLLEDLSENISMLSVTKESEEEPIQESTHTVEEA